MKHMRPFLCAAVLGGAVTLLWQAQPVTAQSSGLDKRIVHTDPATFRMSPAVHGGAGSMGFTSLLNRGAVTPEFNFLHRGVIPPGAGIGINSTTRTRRCSVILDVRAVHHRRRTATSRARGASSAAPATRMHLQTRARAGVSG